ncbi:MAG: hypothetical protein FWG73_00245 [Planctomycetaceae bacterium]|nr:hypothetical protein [Planctomycetaceae bacterium]
MTKLEVRMVFFTPLVFVLLQTSALTNDTQQDIWRVDIHGVARLLASEENFSRLRFYQWDNNRWRPSDAEAFLDSQCSATPLIVLALGYSLTSRDISQVGHNVVRTFDPDKACQIVFWDWFSDRGTYRIRRDIRSKIPIADNAANYLALMLQELEPQSKVCLFGFSFGSRIACQAVESLRQSGRRPDGLRIHLVLSGAAADEHWFARGQRYGNIQEEAERILVTHNPEDWVLRLYPMMYPVGQRPTALGLYGVPLHNIEPEFRVRFENVDVNRYMGHAHQTLKHVRCPAFRNRVAEYFFFE